jgi:O-methyltransferase
MAIDPSSSSNAPPPHPADRLRVLEGRIESLQERLASTAGLEERLRAAERAIEQLQWCMPVVEKAFRVLGLHLNYVEFGVFRGQTLAAASHAAHRVLDELIGGQWHHAHRDGEATRRAILESWDAMRFFAFDSFAGLPPTTGPDRKLEIFQEGTYACSEEDFRQNLTRIGFPMNKLVVVPGFFEESCTPETAARVGLERAGIVNIDSDLYASARTALEFVTPYLANPAILIFDEWFQYFGHPDFGEQRAFREWREAHPEWHVAEFHREGPMLNSFIVTRRD